MYLLLTNKFYHVNSYPTVEIAAHGEFQLKFASLQRWWKCKFLQIINVFREDGSEDLIVDANLARSPYKASLEH